MRAEMLVRSRVEDPEKLRERQMLVESRSVGELARVGSPSEFPLPTTIENILSGKSFSKTKEPQRPESPRSEAGGEASRGGIYGTLPRGLTQELQVKSKVTQKTPKMLAKCNVFPPSVRFRRTTRGSDSGWSWWRASPPRSSGRSTPSARSRCRA